MNSTSVYVGQDSFLPKQKQTLITKQSQKKISLGQAINYRTYLLKIFLDYKRNERFSIKYCGLVDKKIPQRLIGYFLEVFNLKPEANG